MKKPLPLREGLCLWVKGKGMREGVLPQGYQRPRYGGGCVDIAHAGNVQELEVFLVALASLVRRPVEVLELVCVFQLGKGFTERTFDVLRIFRGIGGKGGQFRGRRQGLRGRCSREGGRGGGVVYFRLHPVDCVNDPRGRQVFDAGQLESRLELPPAIGEGLP